MLAVRGLSVVFLCYKKCYGNTNVGIAYVHVRSIYVYPAARNIRWSFLLLKADSLKQAVLWAKIEFGRTKSEHGLDTDLKYMLSTKFEILEIFF